jgi:hypothetical protein
MHVYITYGVRQHNTNMSTESMTSRQTQTTEKDNPLFILLSLSVGGMPSGGNDNT